MNYHKLMLFLPVFTIFFYVNMFFILMMEVPVLENKDNSRKVTKQVENFIVGWVMMFVKVFESFFLLEQRKGE